VGPSSIQRLDKAAECKPEETLRHACRWLAVSDWITDGIGHTFFGMIRASSCFAMAGLLLAVTFNCAASSSDPPIASRFTAQQEGLVKATYIQGFAVFMKWPSHSSLHRSSHFRVCTFGDRQSAMFHEKVVTLVAQAKNVSIWHRFGDEAPPECDIAMVSSRDHAVTESAITALKDQPTLIIGDIGAEPRRSFAIQFAYGLNGKIEYRINRQVLKTRGLEAPARILSMASEVDQ
jgi:hypothetical protein